MGLLRTPTPGTDVRDGSAHLVWLGKSETPAMPLRTIGVRSHTQLLGILLHHLAPFPQRDDYTGSTPLLVNWRMTLAAFLAASVSQAPHQGSAPIQRQTRRKAGLSVCSQSDSPRPQRRPESIGGDFAPGRAASRPRSRVRKGKNGIGRSPVPKSGGRPVAEAPGAGSTSASDRRE
jgi:hypothetical protein